MTEKIGRNRILCGGWLITGPEIWPIVRTLICIVPPIVLYYVFIVPWFINERNDYVVVSVSAVLTVWMLYTFLATAFRDPGILARHDRNIEKTFDPVALYSRQEDPPEFLEVPWRGQIIRMKWCPTCFIYRPPRTIHCAVCDNCVERFDHHCPWVGNCVGARNYRTFFFFLISTTLLSLMVVITDIFMMVQRVNDVMREEKLPRADATSAAFSETRVIIGIILCVYIGIFTVFPGGLLAYHSYLVSIQQTTNEEMKDIHSRSINPYDKGCFSNCVDVLCSLPRRVYINRQNPQLATVPVIPGIPVESKARLSGLPGVENAVWTLPDGSTALADTELTNLNRERDIKKLDNKLQDKRKNMSNVHGADEAEMRITSAHAVEIGAFAGNDNRHFHNDHGDSSNHGHCDSSNGGYNNDGDGGD